MAATQVEVLLSGILDLNGNPLAGGKISSFSAGTNSFQTLYSSNDESSPAIMTSQQVILDAQGRALVYGDGWYKFKVYDANDVLLYVWDYLFYGH